MLKSKHKRQRYGGVRVTCDARGMTNAFQLHAEKTELQSELPRSTTTERHILAS